MNGVLLIMKDCFVTAIVALLLAQIYVDKKHIIQRLLFALALMLL